MAWPDLDSSVYTQLVNDGAITALVSTRIYSSQAPNEAAKPYIIFYLAAGGPENITPTASFNVIYRVESVAEDPDDAQTILEAVFNSLDGTALTITGYTNFWTACESPRHFVDNIEGKQIYRRVIDCRIRGAA